MFQQNCKTLGIRINKRILLSIRITGASGHLGCSTSIHPTGIYFYFYRIMWCCGSHFFRKCFIEASCHFQKIMGPHNRRNSRVEVFLACIFLSKGSSPNFACNVKGTRMQIQESVDTFAFT